MRSTNLFEDESYSSEQQKTEEEMILAARRKKLKTLESIVKSIDRTQEALEGPQTVHAEIAPPPDVYQTERTLRKTPMQVCIPTDPSMRRTIDKLAWRASRSDEARILKEVQDFPDMRFLREGWANPMYQYYRWRRYWGLADTASWWHSLPVEADDNVVLWPPKLPAFLEEPASEPTLEEDELTDDSEEEEIIEIETGLGTVNRQVDKQAAEDRQLQWRWHARYQTAFENMLRQLTMERLRVADGMRFAIDHVDYAEPIADSLLRSIESTEASFAQLVSRLYLVSDILYNATVKVPQAASLRSSLEKRMTLIMHVFADLFWQIPSRLKAGLIQKVVNQLVDLWEGWTVFSSLFCQNLRSMFLARPSKEEARPEEAQSPGDAEHNHPARPDLYLNSERHQPAEEIDGRPIDIDSFCPSHLVDPDLDGRQINI